ncbi:glycerate kinase [Filobacillus milosensis]|uniref:Glycerate kinase n=1 Tax=Filobacillus milosensis TaxID=94137 RepID=A0A4Y8ISK9_9BACI|nr:glycerate kinase [Filobacillus milosensis]TFB21757.1 glycerate kinase [Filobacillus milosensis]
MRITVCPDSFKGSISAQRASEVIQRACRDVISDAIIEQKPMADGGEGTVEALVFATNGKKVQHQVTGPLGEQVESYYGLHGNEQVAFLEVANTAGLTQVPKAHRNPLHTTSYGLGEMLIEVMDKGYRKVVIGLGGSATNDGGLGFLQALGGKFYDDEDNEIGIHGRDLAHVKRVDLSGIDGRIQNLDLRVASDVNNPLCGKQGASHVFGPQKGANNEQVEQLDQWLSNFGELVNHRLIKHSGAGAAGGLGFALIVIGGQLISGAELVAETNDLNEAIIKSDLVITGEGQSDEQTLSGKAPYQAAKIANECKVPIVLVSGSIDDQNQQLLNSFSATFSIINRPVTLSEAIENAEELLYQQIKNIMHFYQEIKH